MIININIEQSNRMDHRHSQTNQSSVLSSFSSRSNPLSNIRHHHLHETRRRDTGMAAIHFTINIDIGVGAMAVVVRRGNHHRITATRPDGAANQRDVRRIQRRLVEAMRAHWARQTARREDEFEAMQDEYERQQQQQPITNSSRGMQNDNENIIESSHSMIDDTANDNILPSASTSLVHSNSIVDQ